MASRRVFCCLQPPVRGRGPRLLPGGCGRQLSPSKHSALLDFLSTPDPVAVFVHPALPAEEAGPGFAYAAPGYEAPGRLEREDDQRRLRGGAALRLAAGLQSGDRRGAGAPVPGAHRPRPHPRRRPGAGTPAAVYIDPRVTVGPGTLLLPGTILRGQDPDRQPLHHRPQRHGPGLHHRRRDGDSTPLRSTRAPSAAAPMWGPSPMSAPAVPSGTTSRWATSWR